MGETFKLGVMKKYDSKDSHNTNYSNSTLFSKIHYTIFHSTYINVNAHKSIKYHNHNNDY